MLAHHGRQKSHWKQGWNYFTPAGKKMQGGIHVLDINITINCPDIKSAAAMIADAILGRNVIEDLAPKTRTPVAPVLTKTVQTTAPTAAPAPIAAPVALVPPAPAAPDAGPSYTVQDLMTAGAALIQGDPSGEARAKLGALLQQYNVKAVTELASEQISTFAEALKALGAKL